MSGKGMMTVRFVLAAVFSGLSTLAFLAGCGGGGGGSTKTTTPLSISVSVSPASVSLNGGGIQAFTATVANDSANAGVTWSIGSGAGTLSGSSTAGVTYTAPATVSATTTLTLTATSVTDATKSGTATITLTPPVVLSISVSVSPASVSLNGGGTQAFTATVANDSAIAGVTWSIGSGVGTLSASTTTGVTYTAQTTVSATTTVTLTATSITDKTKTATATITLNPISVSISPASISLNGGGTQAFTATVANDSAIAGVTWSIGSGVGTLSASTTTGVTYTAQTTVSATTTVTLTATSKTDPTKSGTATITLNPPPTITSVAVSCASTSVPTGQTSQCTATVKGTGSYSSAVTWSVSGVQSGNSTVGTVSTTGLYTAPSAVPSPNPVTVTATSTEDTTKSGSATASVTVATLAITNVSSTTPTPLTAIQISTTGVSASGTVTLTFSNSAGYSATEQAVRVASDGTVIAGVPLYIDPTTNAIGEGTVSLAVSQGSKSSAPASITIQDLPALNTYGTTLGQISHSFLIFESLLHARRLNEFQAAQQLVGTKVDTSKAQSVMQDLMTGASMARSDVDNIMASNSTAYSWGTLNGKAIQFDSTQLDVMDRIIGVYLNQQFLSSSSDSAASLRRRIGSLTAYDSSVHPEFSLASMVGAIGCLASNESACFMEAQEAVQSSPNSTDTGNTALVGFEATLKAGGAEQAAALPGMALGFSHLSSTLDSLFHTISDSAVCNANGNPDGCDAEQQQGILSALNSSGAGIASSIVKIMAGIPAVLGLKVEGATAGIIDNAFESSTKIIGDGTDMAAADTTDVTLVSPTILPLLSGNMGYVTGVAENASTQNTSAPQSSIGLCCIGASALGITALADPDGYYDLLVPLNVPDTGYVDLSLTEENPATFAILATETVDLSSLSSTASVTATTLTTSTTTPDAGSYLGTCTGATTALTCCTGGVCDTSPAISRSGPFDFSLPSGTSISEFLSEFCSEEDIALTEGGWAAISCSYSVSTSDSITISFSSSPPPADGCTGDDLTETCSATLQ